MRVNALIDTGALLALVDRKDAWHSACAHAFENVRLPLGTSAAVLAEFFHLIGSRPRHVTGAWGLIRSSAIVLLPIVDEDCGELEELMRRYADRPMDFADATLVHLARRESVSVVFTVDHDDFETYRVGRRGRFRITPDRHAIER